MKQNKKMSFSLRTFASLVLLVLRTRANINGAAADSFANGPKEALAISLDNKNLTSSLNRPPSMPLLHGKLGWKDNLTTMEDLQAENENLISGCLGRITTELEKCVEQFNTTYRESWFVDSHLHHRHRQSDEEQVRRFCCIQATFKDCWTAAIYRQCGEQERPLARWLPVMVLRDLRNDTRCSNYVLYPHKCRDNMLDLWQIFTFLILVPAMAALATLGLGLHCCPSRFFDTS